jgi:putative endonuclease
MSRAGYVYILSNHSRTLYTGVTNNLERRMYEHKRKIGSQFAAKYNLTQLVYCEPFGDIREAIAREKQIKGWRRERKIALIESANPEWKDLTRDWELALPDA